MEISSPSSWKEFYDRFVISNKPAVINGLMKDWNFFKNNFTFRKYLDHLQNLSQKHLNVQINQSEHADSTIDVCVVNEGHSVYGNIRDNKQTSMTFDEFLECATKLELEAPEKEDGLYLCQCPIFSTETPEEAKLPFLSSEYKLPSILQDKSCLLNSINVWFSVGPTSSNLHYDVSSNLLCVLHGSKRVKLYDPSQTPYLYPTPITTKSSNHSQLDVRHVDYTKHPLFAQAKGEEVTITAGQSLFIPEGYWHQVDSDSLTIAFNFWWKGIAETTLQYDHSTSQDHFFGRLIVQKLIRCEKKRVLDALVHSLMDTSSSTLLQLLVSNGGQLHISKSEMAELLNMVAENPCSPLSTGLIYAMNLKSMVELFTYGAIHHPDQLKKFIMKTDSKTVEVITAKWDNEPHANFCASSDTILVDLEPFYEKFFGIFDDRDAITGFLLDKKDDFSKLILDYVLQTTLRG